MGKIYCIMGKSASGKDTLYKKLLEELPFLGTYVTYTTRPMRSGETEGVEYRFIDEKKLAEFEKEGRIIEKRQYNTVHGIWSYCTVDDGQIELDKNDYLSLDTLESYASLKSYFGDERLVPIYIELEDGERLQRALDREKRQEKPKYEEMCRRFLADNTDFSEENLRRAGIARRFDSFDTDLLKDTVIKEIFNL